MAEYTGLLHALEHAATTEGNCFCFQVDSMLVAEQVQRKWACRSVALAPLLEVAWAAIRHLSSWGGVVIEHIYGEYNKVADLLANQALDTRSAQAWTP